LKGFAFPRAFRDSSLAESLARNMRELVTFMNTFVVRFDDGAQNLTLPADLTVVGDVSATDGTFTGAVAGASGTFTGAVAGASGAFTGALTTGGVNVDVVTRWGAKQGRITSDQSISAGTPTEIDWNSTVFDNGGYSDLANNAFVVPTGAGGMHFVYAHVEWAASVPTQARLEVMVNGSSQGFLTRVPAGTNYNGLSGGALLNLSAGDEVTLEVWYQSASQVRASFSHWSIFRV